MAGRKCKLNKKMIDEMEKLIKTGNYTTTICDYLGIHQSTFYRWMNEGEKEESKLKKELYDTVKKAEAHAEIRIVNAIQMDDSWQSKAWFLERKFPEKWGKKDRHEVTGKDGGAIEFSTDQLREQIIGRINEYATDGGKGEGDTGDNGE